jgi:hypothetical protein
VAKKQEKSGIINYFIKGFRLMKFTLHKTIARYFGYEFIRSSQLAYQSLNHVAGLQSEISCKAIYSGMPSHIESLQFMDQLGHEDH